METERILVAQLTRMGDVLQTSPLIRAIRRRHPNAHITAMVRRMGKAIAECNPDINEIIVYEEDDLFRKLRMNDSDEFLRAYECVVDHIERLRAGNYGVVYNCTHSLASAILFKLAGIPKVVGADLSDDWRYVWRGRGPNYFITSILHREFNDLNLCDQFRYFAEDPGPSSGLVLEMGDHARTAARDLLRASGVSDSDALVCFQLGASDRHKRWPPSQFAELGRLLAEKLGTRILLVGVESEAHLGEAFERHAPGRAAHLFGKTDIPQLAAILERSRALVTNDTGTMHIAAAVGCPVVLLSVGYVHFRETGPYGAGHYAVERRRDDLGRSDLRHNEDDPDCGIRAADIHSLVSRVITSDPAVDLRLDGKDVDVFVSAFAPDGCLEWYPAVPRAITEQDILRMAYRALWIEFLSNTSDEERERATMEASLGRYCCEEGQSIASRIVENREAFVRLGEKARRAADRARALTDLLEQGGSMREAKRVVDELTSLDEEIRVFAEVNRACRPLVAIARYARDNLEGADPRALAAATLDIYRELAYRARAMGEKLSTLGRLLSPTSAAASQPVAKA